MWTRSSTRPGPSISSNSASSFPTIAGAFGTADLIVRIGNTHPRGRFQIWRRRARPRALPRRRRGRHQRAALFYAAAARHSFPEFFAGVDRHRPDDPAAAVDRAGRRDGLLRQGDARRARRVHRALPRGLRGGAQDRPRLERGDHCRFCPARPICPAHTGPLLDLAQFDDADALDGLDGATCSCSPTA